MSKHSNRLVQKNKIRRQTQRLTPARFYSTSVMVVYAFFVSSLFYTASAMSKPISPYLIAQNAHLPSWEGGPINDLWDKMSKAKYSMIRIGGKGAMRHNRCFVGWKSCKRLFELIDGVRSAKAEPIVQIPWEYTAEQTKTYVNHINQTHEKNIQFWSIGNEPIHNKIGDAEFIANYFKRIASAIKSVDPNAIIMGPDSAWYNTGLMNDLIGGKYDITGVDANGHYLLDVLVWHQYNFTTIEKLGKISTDGTKKEKIYHALHLLEKINQSRPADKQLRWGMTEYNTHWNMDQVDNPDQYTWSFQSGQLFAEIWDLGMREGAFVMAPWSIQENSGKRSGTDLGIFGSRSDNFPGRSTYYHSLMLGQNMRSEYLVHSDNQEAVVIIPMGDENGTSVMILNKSRTQSFNYILRLDLEAIKAVNPPPLAININAGLNKQLAGYIQSSGTQLLTFCRNGALSKKYTYGLHDSNTKGSVKISHIKECTTVQNPTTPSDVERLPTEETPSNEEILINEEIPADVNLWSRQQQENPDNNCQTNTEQNCSGTNIFSPF